jgi:AraC-like DNA-binding protein
MLVQLTPYQDHSSAVTQLVHTDLDDRSFRQAPVFAAGKSDSRTIKIPVDRQTCILISVHRYPVREAAAQVEAPQPPEPNTVRISVASARLCEHLDRVQPDAGPHDMLVAEPQLARDPTIAQLAHAVVAADDVTQELGALHADAIGLAIVTRLLSLCRDDGPPASSRRRTPLQKWRLKRVVDYVDGHLGNPIRLPDLAAAAGLTRMHFAAQFRVAMGVRPHHYVLQRRIDRARELLRNPELALVDVALSVGFQTQAHFTTVFRRFVGQTPHRWRRLSGMPEPA